MTPAMRTTAVLLGLSTRDGDTGNEDNNSFALTIPEMVRPAMRTTAVLLGFLNLRDGDTGNEDNSSYARFEYPR